MLVIKAEVGCMTMGVPETNNDSGNGGVVGSGGNNLNNESPCGTAIVGGVSMDGFNSLSGIHHQQQQQQQQQLNNGNNLSGNVPASTSPISTNITCLSVSTSSSSSASPPAINSTTTTILAANNSTSSSSTSPEPFGVNGVTVSGFSLCVFQFF